MNIYQPSIIAHADWSTDSRKRWVCIATKLSNVPQGKTRYKITAPQRAGELTSYFDRLTNYSVDGSVFAGFDFPIGVPAAYAQHAGIKSFQDFLPLLGKGDWIEFFNLCENAREICLRRPFYPKRPGGTRQSHLFAALGVPNIDALRRICERKTPERSSACPLFWTLGGQQVGRASISGWRDLIVPAISDPSLDVRLWPFAGQLDQLVGTGRIVIAETYPAEAGLHIGLPATGRGWSKRSQADRANRATQMLSWASSRNMVVDSDLVTQISAGFGDSKTGEDVFDATVGAMGMLEVLLGHRPEMPTLEESTRLIEGWILGQA